MQVDAGEVHTTGGWRDVKLATFARRRRGRSITAATALGRDLPAPGVRAVVAAVEPAEGFGRRVRGESRRLGRPDDGPLSALGDGVEWVWGRIARHLGQAEPVLDLSHAMGHVAELGRAGFGPDNDAMRPWLDQARRRLLADGWDGLGGFVVTGSAEAADGAAMAAALPALAN